MMSKYTYYIEVTMGNGNKAKILTGYSRKYLEGYISCMSNYAPRLRHAIMRSDGKEIEVLPEERGVYIGAVAGWPTADQYEKAGIAAIQTAESMRSNKNSL